MFLKIVFIIFLPIALGKNGKILLTNEIVEERREFEMLLTDILLSSLRPYKCVALLCDEIYYDMFRNDLFAKMGLYISYFIILIEDSDDLLSPYPDTQEALLMIKRQDCQTYVILISNGIQMSRFLRFGDRYRVLDTRSNFILLYDNRIFEKSLHYIWKRIINVIFIKEYAGTKTVGSVQTTVIPWFEISTVPFPSPIKGILIPRRLDIWRANKFRTGADLFRDKTSDLRNQTVRVVTFQHVPASTRIDVPEFKAAKTIMPAGGFGFTGIEIEILATVAQAMNFHPELYEPPNAATEFWGTKQTDGEMSSLFGELVRSRAEIGLGDFHYTPYILSLMDLTLPYNTECLTFLTPESLTDNSWKTLILPFKPMMWLCVILALHICAVVFYYLARFHYLINVKDESEELQPRKQLPLILIAHDPSAKYSTMKEQFEVMKEEGEPEGLYLFGEASNSLLYTYGMMLMISLPKLPTGWSLRILTGWFWLYCLLVVVTYRASMTAILANPTPRVTIDNLEELVKSKLAVGGWSEINKEFFATSLDPTSQEIGAQYEIINDTDLAVQRVAEGTFALYENTHYLKQATVRRQLRIELQSNNGSVQENTGGTRNLHIMSNCVINMPISIGLQKNSPIKPRVDKFIRRVIEAGLIRKWLDDVMQTTLNAEVNSDVDGKPIMSLKKFIGAVVALLIGYFISVSVFVAEIVYFKKVVKKHPNYDKYSKRIVSHEKDN